MSLKIITILLSFSILVPNLLGSSMDNLDWEAVRNLVRENNPQLRSQNISLESAKMQVDLEKASYLPQVRGRIEHSRRESLSGSGASFSDGTFFAGVNLSQSLYRGGESFHQVERARLRQEAEKIRLDKIKIDLTYELRRRFSSLLYAQKLEELTQKILNRRKENVNLIELRFEGGREDKGPVLLSRANFSQAEFEYRQAVDLRRTAQMRILELIGERNFKPLTLVGTIPYRNLSENQQVSFSNLLEELPDFLISRLEIQVAERGVKIAGAAHLPEIGFSAGIQSGGRSFFPNQTNDLSASIGVSIPLFSGGRDFNRHQIAANTWREATLNHQQKSLELLLFIEESYQRWNQAKAQLNISREFQGAAATRAEIARVKYNNGLLSFEDWDRIESDFINRELAFLRSQRDLEIAQAQWLQIIGDIDL